jgi:hypothetical protein
MENVIEFKKNEQGEYVATTGEVVAYYKGTELWGRGSTGWYITETNGDFRGIKFDTLSDAKFYLVRRNNRNSEQFSKMFSAKVERIIAKIGA